MFRQLKRMLDPNVQKCARLVKRLNSTSPAETRQAAKDLEEVLWPQRSMHPTVLSWEQWKASQNEHFRRVRESDAILPLLTILGTRRTHSTSDSRRHACAAKARPRLLC